MIVIGRYYFPLATSKTILFKDIEKVALIKNDGLTHRWGITRKYLNNWFNYDDIRKCRTKFVEITLKGRRIKPSITPNDPDKVFEIIWANHTPEGKEYSEKMSEQADKETEQAQHEIMEREQEEKEEEIKDDEEAEGRD